VLCGKSATTAAVLSKRRFSFHRHQQQSISPIATQHSHAAVDAPQVSHTFISIQTNRADLNHVCAQRLKKVFLQQKLSS
jgi:hypothetical protein